MRLTAEAGSVSAFHHLRRRILILEAASFSAADEAPPQPLLTLNSSILPLPPSLSLFRSLSAPLDPVNHADRALEAANYVIKLSNCSAPRRRFGRVSASSCFAASLLHFPQVANQFYASFYGCIPSPLFYPLSLSLESPLRLTNSAGHSFGTVWQLLDILGRRHLERRDATQRGIS